MSFPEESLPEPASKPTDLEEKYPLGAKRLAILERKYPELTAKGLELVMNVVESARSPESEPSRFDTPVKGEEVPLESSDNGRLSDSEIASMRQEF